MNENIEVQWGKETPSEDIEIIRNWGERQIEGLEARAEKESSIAKRVRFLVDLGWDRLEQHSQN